MPLSGAASSASTLLRDGQRFGKRYRSSRDVLGQILALNKLHDECTDLPGLLQPMDDRDVGVVQRGQGPGFALEPRAAVRVGGERLRQDLDRDVAPQAGIARAVDFAHPARTDEAHDLVGAQASRRWQGPSLLAGVDGGL